MKNLSLFLWVLCFVLLCFALVGCATTLQSPQKPDPAQVGRIAATAQAIVGIGVQGVLQSNPAARPQLLAVAEVLEQAMAMRNVPEPHYLTQAVSAAIAQFGGPYGVIASLAVNGGLAFYRNFYQANTNSALDKTPAFREVLEGMARGIREGVGVPAGPSLELDLVLKPATSNR